MNLKKKLPDGLKVSYEEAIRILEDLLKSGHDLRETNDFYGKYESVIDNKVKIESNFNDWINKLPNAMNSISDIYMLKVTNRPPSLPIMYSELDNELVSLGNTTNEILKILEDEKNVFEKRLADEKNRNLVYLSICIAAFSLLVAFGALIIGFFQFLNKQ